MSLALGGHGAYNLMASLALILRVRPHCSRGRFLQEVLSLPWSPGGPSVASVFHPPINPDAGQHGACRRAPLSPHS